MTTLSGIITPTNLVTATSTETLTNKTLTAPVFSGIAATASGNLRVDPATQILEVLGDGVSVVGQLQLNCHVNSHGQVVASQPHSEGATNVLTLPGGTTIGNANAVLVSNTGTQTLTNKTLTAPTINGITGVLDTNTGASIASAATINLNTSTGNRVHITGTTAITAVTLTRGPRTVIFDGILTLTHNATTNNLPGAANITTAAGDRAIYESDGTTVYCVSYIKVSGAAVVSAGGSLLSRTVFTASGTWTKGAGTNYILISGVGGGGGGGGSNNCQITGGSGGGAGGYAEKFIAATASETVTIGAGGAGGAVASIGATGGTTSFGSHISSAGGTGGDSNGNNGGNGGTATNGDLNSQGGGGGGSIGTANVPSGMGGSSYFGGGGWGQRGSTSGNAGKAFGSGGGGANNTSSSSAGAAGGAGKAGIIIVEEYA